MNRKLSWLLAGIAYIGPPLWAYFSSVADQHAQLAAYGFIKCGNTQTGITFLACVASGSLSSVALALGLVSLRSVPSPRPRARLLEMVAVSMPLLVAVLIVSSPLWG